ncbi:tRNA (5-methylaminomethyl-2-thiouridine)(34)-methyltransferase MnmD [Myroides sp. JBRI-B21084]|uniref:tRNA (5-methylaminomethyl-2-thiouridine)(34)-methyltransferase MnmD n=1 Tax=Myroides sp. JBRI-B21084 TaxID=3119977 RepID=UPI0026E1CB10|nr:tRNA (5-methylaminomethyl-2-thiouridine)(34)-methyltransferase MnmD [Paenimyroides cloacae]WKW47604.1 tRNA (5-methylaminomethyl-2-thiouridine)(34)-methyltransferase MnmD [Paenimyroides cloacae]
MEREIIVTDDGSHSLFVKNMGETFHSKHGAVQESVHVYINNGIKRLENNQISVLEFGFGTGLNALLTLQFATDTNKKIKYETIEAFPLIKEEYQSLNYNKFVSTNVSLQYLHELPFGKTHEVTPLFAFQKHHNKIEDFTTNNTFDIIYFDVFGYDYQSELWSKEILTKAYQFLKPNGLFVTYACKGIVNKQLKEIGFTVEKLTGPPGKREMICAVKKN